CIKPGGQCGFAIRRGSESHQRYCTYVYLNGRPRTQPGMQTLSFGSHAVKKELFVMRTAIFHPRISHFPKAKYRRRAQSRARDDVWSFARKHMPAESKRVRYTPFQRTKSQPGVRA